MIRWNSEKNLWLSVNRGVTFDEVVQAMSDGLTVDHYEHPDQVKYPGQKVFVVMVDGYPCLVPYVMDGGDLFLKTIIPSRKAKKKYTGGSDA